MLYFKYKDYDEARQIAALPSSEYNKWVEEHHFGTCSCCHQEYLYVDSPVLKNHIWNKVVSALHLTELNDKVESKPLTASSYYSGTEKALNIKTNAIITVTPDDQHCTICKDCMEKALQRKLALDDLVMCSMNNHFIKKFLS